MKTVVSLSGGLDSTILVYYLVDKYGADNVACISYNYNQRHDVELECAKRTTAKLGVRHKIIDISFLGDLVSDVSSMVKGDVATPTVEDILGDPQPNTYVPFRNLILSSLTASYCESIGFESIALGIQAIDGYCYWDTTPDFAGAMQDIFNLNRKTPIQVQTPFVELDKSGELEIAKLLNVPLEDTWTCYNPDIEVVAEQLGYHSPNNDGDAEPCTKRTFLYAPCGKCPSCREREAAFAKADIKDPIVAKGVLCVE